MVNFFTFLRAAFAMQVGQIIEDRRVRNSGWPVLAWGFSDPKMTWLLYCAGAGRHCLSDVNTSSWLCEQVRVTSQRCHGDAHQVSRLRGVQAFVHASFVVESPRRMLLLGAGKSRSAQRQARKGICNWQQVSVKLRLRDGRTDGRLFVRPSVCPSVRSSFNAGS